MPSGAQLQAMASGVVSYYQPYLLVYCLTIGHAFWRGASLATMPNCVLLHYRSCLLVWYLIINHACWCGSLLYTMPVGGVPHYRLCLLVNCHCNQYFTGRVQMEEGWLQVWCYLYRGVIISVMIIRCHSQICLLVQCNYIRHSCWVHEFIFACLKSVTLPSKLSGLLQIHQTCLQVEFCSHRVVKLVGYHPGCHLEYVKF